MTIPRPVTMAVVTASFLLVALGAVLFGVGGFAAVEILVFAPALVSFLVVGAVVLLRQPSNVVGLLMLVFGAVGCAIVPVAAVGAREPSIPGAATAGVFVQAFDPVTYLLVSLLLLAFPDGRLPSPRWLPVVVLAVAGLVLSVAGNLFTPGSLMVFPQHTNPIGLDTPIALAAGAIGYLLAGVAMLLSAGSLVVRWRRSETVERAQLKWIAFSGAVLGSTTAGYIVAFSAWGSALLPTIASSIAFSLFPVAVAIAVLRYRLYEIDRIISRTLGWAIVTGVVAIVFVGVVVALQAILGGVTQGQTLSVAASTLVAVALFQPLRRRIQRVVDRRFDRARYDGERTTAGFTERLRGQVDMGAVRDDLMGTVGGALRPSGVGLWLRGSGGDPTRSDR